MENQEMHVLLVVKKAEITRLANEKQQQLNDSLNAMLTHSSGLFSQLSKLKDDVQVLIHQQQAMLETFTEQWLQQCHIEQEFSQLKEKFNEDMSNQEMMQLLDETSQVLENRLQRNSEDAFNQLAALKKQGAQLLQDIQRQFKQLQRQRTDKSTCSIRQGIMRQLKSSKFALANALEKCAVKLKAV